MLLVVKKEIFVDWVAPVYGTMLPADHPYGSYSAQCKVIPEIRQHPEIGILSVPGIPDRQGKIYLTPQSHLRIRVPVAKIPIVYPLAGKKLTIGRDEIKIGVPSINLLKPHPKLKARIVTIKNKECMQPEGFIKGARRQLANLGIDAQVSIPLDRNGEPARKTIKIKRQTTVGFTTIVSELSEEDSLQLQYWGIGGRRHIGAGIFLPC